MTRVAALALLAPLAAGVLSPTADADTATHARDRVETAAAAIGWSEAKLREVLRTDPTARLDRDARLYYVEPASTHAASPVGEGVAPFPLGQTFLLHSRPSSTHSIYLDFDGATVSGTAWNSTLPNGTYAGYSLDGLAGFSDVEKEEIQKVWQRVSEDYAAFDVDVTTQDPGAAGLDRTNAADQRFGTRALISDDTTASGAVCPGGCGGIAYVGVFDSTAPDHSFYQPAWIFGHLLAGNDTKDIAEAVSHEVGHNFGLSHDGTSTVGYYQGHAMWAPIMGVGYQRPVTQWSKGEYALANNTENDLSIIANGGAPVIADEAGGTVGTAAAAVPVKGFITSASDTDTFALGTCSGTVTVTATGAAPSPDLDIKLELLAAGGTTVATANPASAFVNRDSASGLGATVTAGVATGAYYARVDGVGNGTGITGYTDYASIGGYTLSVSGCDGQSEPSAPTDLVVTADSSGTSATATWSAPASDGGSPVTGYEVSRSGGSTDTQTALTKTWTGLTPGAGYQFSVAATNSIGTGVPATRTLTMPSPASPQAPLGLAVTTDPVAQTAHVTWNPPADDGGLSVTSYHVLVDGSVRASGAARSVSLTGFSRGSTHTVAVRAVNAVGAGPTASRTVTVDDTPAAPALRKARSGKKGGKVTASIRWRTPADGGLPITGYQVLVMKARSGRLVETVPVGADASSYVAVLRHGRYRFEVSALNSLGTGESSAPSRAVRAR